MHKLLASGNFSHSAIDFSLDNMNKHKANVAAICFDTVYSGLINNVHMLQQGFHAVTHAHTFTPNVMLCRQKQYTYLWQRKVNK